MGDYRYDALQNLTCARFLNYLFLKFSPLAQEDIFSNTFGATSAAIIEEFHSVDEIAYMDIEDHANFISNKGKGYFTDPKQVAEAVRAAARSSL